MLTGAMPMEWAENAPLDPRIFGVLFAAVGGLFFLFGQAMAWLTIYSGKLLKKQQKHTFSFVIACILCVFFPFGTVLGVFTIIALQDQEVKALYPMTKV